MWGGVGACACGAVSFYLLLLLFLKEFLVFGNYGVVSIDIQLVQGRGDVGQQILHHRIFL